MFPYLAAIDCVAGNGEYGRSDSLPGGTFAASSEFGKEFVYVGCKKDKETQKANFAV